MKNFGGEDTGIGKGDASVPHPNPLLNFPEIRNLETKCKAVWGKVTEPST